MLGRLGPLAMSPFPRAAAAFVVSLLLPMACARPSPDNSDAVALLAQYAQRAAEAERAGRSVVEGTEGWLFFAPELRHLGVGPFWGERAAAASRAPRAEDADPGTVIRAMKQQLDTLGIPLLVVPVPAKAVVYADALAPGAQASPPPRIDVHDREFLRVLEASGVNVLDLAPLFLDARARSTDDLYCRTDTHWSGHGVSIAAGAIAERLQAGGLPRVARTEAYESEWRTVEINGDLQRAMPDAGRRERVSLRFVGTPSVEGLVPTQPRDDAAVLVVGDSHVLVFHAGGDMHASGAGLPDQLALALGQPIDVAGVMGAGTTAAWVNVARKARRTPGYWATKRAVVWVFSVREFTETDGWRVVPLG